METFFEILFKTWVTIWMSIIFTIPQILMGGLTFAIIAMTLTFKDKDREF